MTRQLSPVILDQAIPFDDQSDKLRVLWGKVHQYERRNTKAENKIEVLYTEYKDTVLPYEKRLGGAQCSWVGHLLSFVPAKSLKKADRERLLDYIDYEMGVLFSKAPFCDQSVLEKLVEEYQSYCDRFFAKECQQALEEGCDHFESMIEEMFGGEVEMPDRQIIRDVLSRGNELEVMELIEAIANSQKPSESTCNRQQNKSDEWHDTEFEYFEGDEEQPNKIKDIFKGSQLNLIYKRVASVVHPDKEQDDDKREEKTRIMQKLASAKKEGDVVTLIKLYSEFVPDGDRFLDETSLKQVEHLLEAQIKELNSKHRDLFNAQGFKSYVWKEYSASSKKKIRANLEERVVELDVAVSTLKGQIAQLKSMKEVNRFVRNQASMLEAF